MVLHGRGTLCVCLLLAVGAVSLPTNNRQNVALASKEHHAKEEKFQFLPPRKMSNLNLLVRSAAVGKTANQHEQLHRLERNIKPTIAYQQHEDQHEHGNVLATQPGDMSNGSSLKLSAIHLAASTAARGTETKFLIVVCVLAVILVSLYYICSREYEESEIVTVAARYSSPKGNDALIAQEHWDGSWARAYRNADDKNKGAFEFLFRCHIIPQEEFAHSHCTQEQIDECLWIATYMLNERPLEQWMQLSSFEKDPSTCFKELKEIWTGYYQDAKSASGADQQVSQAQAVSEETKTSPPRGELKGRDARTPSVTSSSFALPSQQDAIGASVKSSGSLPNTPRSSIKSGSPMLFRDPKDADSLLKRCRQIMQSSDSERKRWSSMPASLAQALPETPSTMQSAGTGEAPPTRGMQPAPTSAFAQNDKAEQKQMDLRYASAKF